MPMGLWPRDYFHGKAVLVVGGCSGIGLAIARAYLAEGAKLTVTGVSDAEVAAAETLGSGVTVSKLDIRDASAVAASIAGLHALDHVVCTAGIIRRGKELDPAVFDAVVDVNLGGSMRVAAAARARMAGKGGTILLTASMLSFFGGGLVPGYAASKGGIAQLTKSLAIAYAGEGIRVNALAPGWIATEMTRALQEDPARSEAIMARTPMKRWGRPEDLCGAALFLSSPLADFITGVILPVDGGYLVA
jgi:NAD(P)-dependent dehydrogenase (short-subunit alcohol dehydrogenase family)